MSRESRVWKRGLAKPNPTQPVLRKERHQRAFPFWPRHAFAHEVANEHVKVNLRIIASPSSAPSTRRKALQPTGQASGCTGTSICTSISRLYSANFVPAAQKKRLYTAGWISTRRGRLTQASETFSIKNAETSSRKRASQTPTHHSANI